MAEEKRKLSAELKKVFPRSKVKKENQPKITERPQKYLKTSKLLKIQPDVPIIITMV